MDLDRRTWYEWLTHTLPAYLNRDPQAIPALSLGPPPGSPGLVRIAGQVLDLPGTGRWDLTQYDLADLGNALTAQGWTATRAPGVPGTLTAAALVDTGTWAGSPTALQDVTAYPWLAIPGSVLWQVVRPLAQTWDALWAPVVQLLLGQLTGPWLDNLGTYLQVPRIGGEPDSLYQTRLYGLAITGSPNGVAMEAFFAALGYTVAVTDTTPGALTATVQWPTAPPQGFVYSQAELASMIETLKAVGVIATVVFASQLTDSLTAQDRLTATSLAVTGLLWGGTLPDGTGAAQGFPWNETVWR